MSRWTSERAILRDLSLAQGGRVALAQGGRALGGAERPPPLPCHEETEEEYFKHCVGDGVMVDKPDLRLIQQMLDMVRNLNVTEDETNTNDLGLISKLNPCSSEFVPPKQVKPPLKEVTPLKNNPTAINIPAPKRPKRIGQRNIALESIFQAIESQKQANDLESNSEPLKLLKPEDLVPNTQVIANKASTDTDILNVQVQTKPSKKDTDEGAKAISEAVEKVNDWMSQMMSPIRTKSVAVVLDNPTSMFKKKSKTVASKPCVDIDTSSMFKRKVDVSKVTESKAFPQRNNNYVPSTQARQYYQKYLEKSQLIDSLNDDIWTKAEKKMKQIDEEKRIEASRRAALDAEADASSATVAPVLSNDGISDADAVAAGEAWLVGRARHGAEPDARVHCAVCRALTRRGTRLPARSPGSPPSFRTAPERTDISDPLPGGSDASTEDVASSPDSAEEVSSLAEMARARRRGLQRTRTLVDLNSATAPATTCD